MPQPAASADQLDASSNDLVLPPSTSLLHLPDEILSHICLMLAVSGRYQDIAVNRQLKRLANDDQFNRIAGLQIDAAELELFERYKTFSSLDEFIALASQYQALAQDPSATSPKVQAAFAQLQQQFGRGARILKAHIAYLAHTADNHPDSFNLCSALDNLFSHGVICREITQQQFDIYYDLRHAFDNQSRAADWIRYIFVYAMYHCWYQNVRHPIDCDWYELNPFLNSSRLRLNPVAAEVIVLNILDMGYFNTPAEAGAAALVRLDALKFMEPYLEKNKKENAFILLLIKAAKELEGIEEKLNEFFSGFYNNFLRVVSFGTPFFDNVEKACNKLNYQQLKNIINFIAQLDSSELKQELSYYALQSLKKLFCSQGSVSRKAEEFWDLVFELNDQDQTFIDTVFKDTLNARFSFEERENFVVSLLKNQIKNPRVFFKFFPLLKDVESEQRKKLIFNLITRNEIKFMADEDYLTKLMSILPAAEQKFAALLVHIIFGRPLPEQYRKYDLIELEDVCIYAILHSGAGFTSSRRIQLGDAANDRLLLTAARSKPTIVNPVFQYGQSFFNSRSQAALENAICAAAKQGAFHFIDCVLNTGKIYAKTLRVVFKNLIIYCYRAQMELNPKLVELIDRLAGRKDIEAGFIDRESRKEIKSMFVLARFRQKIREVEGFDSYEGSIARFRRECMAVQEVNDLCRFKFRLDNVVQPLNEHYRSRFSSVQSKIEAIIDEIIERAKQLDNNGDLLVAPVALSNRLS